MIAGGSERSETAGHSMIEMNSKGLLVDPITNMPIIFLRDSEGE